MYNRTLRVLTNNQRDCLHQDEDRRPQQQSNIIVVAQQKKTTIVLLTTIKHNCGCSTKEENYCVIN